MKKKKCIDCDDLQFGEDCLKCVRDDTVIASAGFYGLEGRSFCEVVAGLKDVKCIQKRGSK